MANFFSKTVKYFSYKFNKGASNSQKCRQQNTFEEDSDCDYDEDDVIFIDDKGNLHKSTTIAYVCNRCEQLFPTKLTFMQHRENTEKSPSKAVAGGGPGKEDDNKKNAEASKTLPKTNKKMPNSTSTPIVAAEAAEAPAGPVAPTVGIQEVNSFQHLKKRKTCHPRIKYSGLKSLLSKNDEGAAAATAATAAAAAPPPPTPPPTVSAALTPDAEALKNHLMELAHTIKRGLPSLMPAHQQPNVTQAPPPAERQQMPVVSDANVSAQTQSLPQPPPAHQSFKSNSTGTPSVMDDFVKYADIDDIELPDGSKIGYPSDFCDFKRFNHSDMYASTESVMKSMIPSSKMHGSYANDVEQCLNQSSQSGHSGDESLEIYACRHCGKKYRWKSTLRRHENDECGGKEPAHECPYCPYKAKQRGNLGVHVRKHHADRPQLESRRKKRMTF